MNEQRTDAQVRGEDEGPSGLTGREAELEMQRQNAPRYFQDAAGQEPIYNLAAVKDGTVIYHEVPMTEEAPAHMELGKVADGAFVVDEPKARK